MSHETPLDPSFLSDAVRDARTRTLAVVLDLDPAELTVPLREDVNPFLWEMGHVAYFFDVFVLRPLGAAGPVLAGSDDLYDSFTVDHDDRWQLALPSREATIEYMGRVMELCLSGLGARGSGARESYLYRLAVLHEDMHGEAFAYMRQTLGYREAALTDARASRPPEAGPLPGDVEVPAGTCLLGADPGDPFVFDNEKWAHPVEVTGFRIARAPVTNAEFTAFVEDRGYLRRELWSRQGWAWRTRAGAEHPIYWRRGPGGWLRLHFDRLVALEAYAPVVHVSWYEAEAFCRWAARRLPSEAEWEVAAGAEPAAGGRGVAGRRRYPWGDDPPTAERANLDGRLAGCVDVAALAAGDSAFGCRQMLGNVWEWTASPFYPYPGFVVDTPYREYSAPWFGYRRVLRGGAWVTRSRLIHNRYRNFFLPHRRDIFAGFRTCAP